MSLVLVTAPTVEPLTATEAKARLDIGDDVPDAVMDVFIKASRQMIDGARGWPGIAIITQTWDLFIDQFEGYGAPIEKGFYARDYYGQGYRQSPGIVIPLPPTQSITSVKYYDSDGVQQTVDSSVYLLKKGEPSHLVLATGQSWPSPSTIPGSVTIRFVAGYGDAGSDVDETLRLAIALQASHLRQMASPDFWMSSVRVEGIDSFTSSSSAAFPMLNEAVKQMLAPYRVWT